MTLREGDDSKASPPPLKANTSHTAMPEKLGRYRVKKQLGGGGMGAVYLVENTELRREEALKVPHFESGDDPAVCDRFLREALALASLDHPNLCTIYDAGVIDGVYYLTMRYLPGEPLSELARRSLAPREAVKIVCELAKALQHAHGKGVIHRDLKPSNVIMCPDTGPTVMDFGLAKQTQQPNKKLTQIGTLMGTPAYMPPEQVKGDLDRIGPATDVYSLGVVLFELLTGRLPFEGDAWEILSKILCEEAPLPSRLKPGLSPDLDALCRKALAKAPEARYASMKDFADALTEVLRSLPTVVPAPPIASPADDLHEKPTISPDASWGELPSGPPRARQTNLGQQVPDTLSRTSSRGLWLCLILILGGGAAAMLFLRFGKQDAIPESFTNDIGMSLAVIPKGKFQMGAYRGEVDRHKDESMHEVTMSAFFLGVHEVTQKQFREVMGWNPSWFSKNASGSKDADYRLKPGGGAAMIPKGDDTEDYPVENVSWEEANAFCEKLTAKDTKKPTGWKYCLPTEAQWEYACRGEVPSQSFHFGDSLSAERANFDFNTPGDRSDKIKPLSRTCKVGCYPANGYGLHDMHGNVREWCADWYQFDYPQSPSYDPPGPVTGSFRVVRGGGWSFMGRLCRTAYRGIGEPESRDFDRGFRVALVPTK